MKTFLKRLLSIFLVLAGLLVLFHLIENWRGSRAMAKWREAAVSAGMPQTLEEMAPPKFPEAENFATHPSIADAIAGREGQGGPVLPAVFSDGEMYRAWEEGKQVDLEALKRTLKVADLGSLLSPFDAQLQGLEEASLRPHCRLMSTYDDNVPALLGMRQRARVLSLRAILALRDGSSETALGDVLTILRVAKHLRQEPHLISQLLRIAYVKLSFQPIWEGLAGHQWNDQQLSRLQDALTGIDLLESWRRSWIAESIYSRGQMAKMADAPIWPRPHIFGDSASGGGRLADYLSVALIPKGWIYQNLISIDRQNRAQFIDVIDPARHFLDARGSERASKTWAQTPRSPYTMLAKLYIVDNSAQNIRLGQAQSTLDQALIACGLERYLLAHKTYPERLDDLIPVLGTKPPVDIVGETSIHYQKASRDSYLLYSIGWNGADEGGKAVFDSQQPSRRLLEQGDWVWFGPTNKASMSVR